MSVSTKHTIHKKTNFTIIPNELINNHDLSLESRMLLIWALSKPKTWKLNYKALCTTHRVSNDKLRRMVKELQDCRYLIISRVSDGSTEWHWYDSIDSDNRIKEKKPHSENPNSENQNSDNRSALVSTDLIERKDLLVSTMGNCIASEVFENVWRHYPVKKNKKKAKALFVSLVKKKKLNAKVFGDGLIDDIEMRCKYKQFGFDKMHFTTYLNGERWLDDIELEKSKQSGISSAVQNFDFNNIDLN